MKQNMYWLKRNYISFRKNLNYYQQKIMFFLGGMYFTSDDGSQNMFVYQEAPNTLELKKRQRY